MQIGRPLLKSMRRAVPGKHRGLQACSFLLYGSLILTSGAMAAAGAKPAGKQAAQPAASDFVGSDTCAGCHEEVSNKFAANPHTKMAQMHGKQGVTCENRHGAGKAHVDGGGDVTKIFNPTKATAKEVDERCLSCHRGQHSNFEKSGHGDGNVSCVGCHSVHAGKDPEHLLKLAQPTLCY